jgi:hypothetical protein
MSHRPLIVPMVAPSRSILLPASFAGCGVLLLALFVVLMGCAPFSAGIEGEVKDPDKNAVLCSCECDPPAGPIALPWKNFIAVGADDAAQGGTPPANLGGNQLNLGQNSTVGLRFQELNVPPLAKITSAKIQFTGAQTSSPGQSAALQIHMVNSPNAAPFGPPAVDLQTLPLIAGHVDWAPGPWKVDETADNERTPDLAVLLQAIVNDPQYTPDSAVAFIIAGQGVRTARAKESNNPQPAFLTVEYLPKKAVQEFLTCAAPADAADPAKAAAVCQGAVQSNVSDLGKACGLASACTCKLKTADAISFSAVCKEPCPAVVAPTNCDPAGIAQTTQATAGHTPVCVANSPLGSLLTGRLSACDLDEASSGVSVTVRDEDGENPHTRGNTARGRVQFVGTPCPGDPLGCFVGLNHRINVNEIFFNGGVFGSDHTLTDLTGVGEATGKAFVDNTGAGTFAPGSTVHSARGTDVNEGSTKGFFRSNSSVLTVSVGDWQPGGACSLGGDLFDSKQLTLHSNLHGRLVNQPPTAIAGDDQQVECNQTSGATFSLDGSQSYDPDNNVASFGWFKGSRTGQLLANLPRVQLDQPVSTPTSNNATSYVFKVIDAFGQYDEDTTKVNVLDTTPPKVTAPPDPPAVECAGPAGTPVDIGIATATDVCDASPDLTNNAPQLFPLGTTTVTYTARDDSGNTSSATQKVLVQDKTPPVLTVTLSPTVLWPPDHKLVPITATITVQDICDPNPTVRLVSIKSNELDNGLGDGDTSEDIQGATFGTDDRAFLLRSERSGPGGGRVYTVTYQASDASGNTTTKQAFVTVPKNQSAKP